MGDDFPNTISAQGPRANAAVLQRDPSSIGGIAQNRRAPPQFGDLSPSGGGVDPTGGIRCPHSRANFQCWGAARPWPQCGAATCSWYLSFREFAAARSASVGSGWKALAHLVVLLLDTKQKILLRFGA